ncbi:hypothetical protein DFH06DRAFT_49538 [Mycena polygramma]|nr:hypothetical protein DFH06DRAFT_49538 [Mycena polygramma]
MNGTDAPWRVRRRPCPFYQQGRCVFDQSCNFVHDISIPIASTSSSASRLPELLDALGDVLDPPDTISLVSEHGTSPHISGEGWTLVNDTSVTKDSLLSPVSLDIKLSRLSTLKNDSFDSGYGSEFSSPQPLPSTLNLLASPFGSSLARASLSGSRLFARGPFSPGYAAPTSREDSPELDSPDLDSPATTRRPSVSTIRPGDEGEEDDTDQYSTAQWDISPDTTLAVPPPTSRFSTSTLALTEDYRSDSDEEDAEESTAHLAYLASPSPRPTMTNENDTINTLYDVYLNSPPQPVPPSDAEDRGRIRARVFTPPPPTRNFNPRKSSTPPVAVRSESRTAFPPSAFSDSPEPTPPRSLSSMSNRGKVPFGFRHEGSSRNPEMSSPEPMPSPPLSGKVPFGFRSEAASSRPEMSSPEPLPSPPLSGKVPFRFRSEDSPETPPPRSFSSMSNRGKVPFGFRVEATSGRPEMSSPEPMPSPPISANVPFAFRSEAASGRPEMSSPEPMPSPPISAKVPFGFRSESRNSRRSIGPVSASALQTAFSHAPPRKRRISRSVAPQSASAQRTSFFQSDSAPSPPPTVKGLKQLRLVRSLGASC